MLTVLNNDVNIEHVADKNATKNESFFDDDLSIFSSWDEWEKKIEKNRKNLLTISQRDVNIGHVENKKRRTATANVRSKSKILKNKKILKNDWLLSNKMLRL